METIARAARVRRPPGASELEVAARRNPLRAPDASPTAATTGASLDDLNLLVRPGERVGLVGRSGAGKSTLVNLLLRFYDVEQGPHPHRRPGHRRRHAGEPARGDRHGHAGHFAAASLDRAPTSATAAPSASRAEIEAAARKAQAHDFIIDLADWKGRTGYDAHVGERGVKLSRRPAPAHRHRARDAEGRADPDARRGDLGARQRSRARDPGAARRPDGRQDGDRDRAPALDHRAHGPADRARRGRIVEQGTHDELFASAATTRSSGGTSPAASSQTSSTPMRSARSGVRPG